MNRITPFTLQQNIATDNAFSTIQVIHQLLAKVKEVIEVVNNIELDYESYTDGKILELKTQLESQIGVLRSEVADLNELTASTVQLVNQIAGTVNELQQIVAQNYATLNAKIDENKIEMLERLSDLSSGIINYLDAQISLLYEELDRLIKERTAYAYSSWAGEWKPISEAMNDQNKFLALKRSRYLSLELVELIEASCSIYYGESAPPKFSEYTIDELDTVLESLEDLGNFDTISLRTSPTASPTVIGGVHNTVDDFAVNNFHWMYYIWYKIGRNRDVSSQYVTWYSIYNTLNVAIGFIVNTYNDDFTITGIL